ncbi:MAG: MinD/ParA family protein [Epsilonproteobacteria bacterium]|nr:MinD/ParA family protein [Campylobacterota bacterium]
MRIVTITSGKGGVGKSTLAANIAYMLSKFGYKVALFDADLGLANQDILLNVQPKYSLYDIITQKVSLEDALVRIEQNLYLIPGDHRYEAADMEPHQIRTIIQNLIEALEGFDFLLIDTGAGIGSSVQELIKAATDVVVVTLPEPPAVMDAYVTLKYAQMINKRSGLVVNGAKNEKEAKKIYNRLIEVLREYGKCDTEFLGYVQRSPVVTEATKKRLLISKEFEYSGVSSQIASIAKRLIGSLKKSGEPIKEEPSLTLFFKRLLHQI